MGRRGFLLGGAAGVGTLVAGGYAVEEDWLPGRPSVYSRLGLNGPDGRVPDVAPGPVVRGTLRSASAPGRDVGWAVVLPPEVPAAGSRS